MKCPSCKKHSLVQKIQAGLVDIDVCHSCDGMWFEGGKLSLAKDKTYEHAKWFDFDLWKDPKTFKSKKGDRACPSGGEKLHKLHYGDSDVVIDACRECNGIWLDKNEFEKIMKYVKTQSSYEVLYNYTRNLIQEGKEVVSGPENLSHELVDVLMLIKLFQYKFATQHPGLTTVFLHLPLTS